MSFDYYVAVHQANWPTAAALQSCMAERKYPVVLDYTSATPLAIVSDTLGLPLRFENRPIALEADIVQLSPTVSYAYSFDRPPDWSEPPGDRKAEVYLFRPNETLKGQDINADLAKIGAKNVSFGNGDYVLTLSFRSSADEIRAGAFVMAAMIKCFGGYGFEFQSGTHGTEAFANDLVNEASDEKLWRSAPSAGD